MSKIVIGALGTNQMQPTVYAFEDGKQYSSPYFVHALVERVGATHVIMLLTPEAYQAHWELIKQNFLDLPDVNLEPVTIEMGAAEVEVWRNFTRIAEHIYEDDEIYFDVTNGFRSLPLIFLSAVRYFQQSLGIVVRGIYYGALEAVRREIQPKPVFRLDLFMTLGDWATAVDLFLHSGEVNRLVTLLKTYDFDSVALRRSFGAITTQLQSFSQALQFNRPIDVMHAAATLLVGIQAFYEDREHIDVSFEVFPQPFMDLLSKVARDCAPFAMDRAAIQPKTYAEYLQRQLLLIHWCNNHEKPHAAIVIAREWILSWTMFVEGKSVTEMRGFNTRDRFRKEAFQDQHLNTALQRLNGRITPHEVWQVFNKVSALRNDLAHAGMVASPTQINQIPTAIEAIFERLDRMGAAL